MLAEAHALLGQALLDQDRNAEAEAAARAALGLDPFHLHGLAVLADALGSQERYDAGLQVIDRALRLAPDSAMLHRQSSALHLGRNRVKEGLGAAERAVELDPEDSDNHVVLASALFTARRRDEAQAALGTALALDPQNARAHQLRATLSLLSGDRRAVRETGTNLASDPSSELNRELHGLASKSRNPVYGLLLRFGVWMASLPPLARVAILLSPLVLIRVLRPVDDQLWAQLLIGVVIALVVASWTLEPLMNSTLLASREGRGLLRPLARRATVAFLVYLLAAAVVSALVLATDRGSWNLAAAYLLWGASAGMVHTIGERRRRLALRLHAVGATLAVVAAGSLAVPALWPFGLLLLLGGVAMLWFTSLA